MKNSLRNTIIFACFLSFFTSCVVGKNGTSDDGQGRNNSGAPDGQHTDEPGKPVGLSKIVAISMSSIGSITCALDDKSRAACWSDKTKFVPNAPGSTKGSNELDFPKKSNADLAAGRYVDIASNDLGAVCAVNSEGKVDCFMPSDASRKNKSELAAMGTFTKVVISSANKDSNYFCVIDTSGVLTCHNLDLSSLASGNDIVDTEEITALSLGNVLDDKRYSPIICWITRSNKLSCAGFSDNHMAAQVEEKASALTAFASGISYLAALSLDKKRIKIFGAQRKIAIKELPTFDLSKTYTDVKMMGVRLCGIVAGTNEVDCQNSKADLQDKKSNDDIAKETFKKISPSLNRVCALGMDDKISCWLVKNVNSDVPSDIKAD